MSEASLPFLEELESRGDATVELSEARPHTPVLPREVIAVLLTVVASDLAIYRGHGFAGISAFLLVVPVLFALGISRPSWRPATWIIAGMIVLLAARMLWLGSAVGVAIGLSLLVAFSLAVQGTVPHVLRVLLESLQTLGIGGLRLCEYTLSVKIGPRIVQRHWLSVVLPVVVVSLFAGLFVMANHDLVEMVTRVFNDFARWLDSWWTEIPIRLREVLFWIAVAWFVAGLLRPRAVAVEEPAPTVEPAQAEPAPLTAAEMFDPARNTLIGVIVLFAAYLVFEFRSQWFHDPTIIFDYSDYCHYGAAWLTAALAVATLTLSLIFRGLLLNDPRVTQLRKLAWIWSVENLLLAIAVFGRLHIYIDYTGMTRMRTVALYGVSTVIAGFVLVVWKIARGKSFSWLIGRQLWALALAVYLFALTPVDYLAHSYNARQIMSGDMAPIVPIVLHEIDSEGMLALEPLLDSPNAVVRDGLRAMFAKRATELESLVQHRKALGWTSYQSADLVCLKQLQKSREKWEPFLDTSRQSTAIGELYGFGHQWF